MRWTMVWLYCLLNYEKLVFSSCFFNKYTYVLLLFPTHFSPYNLLQTPVLSKGSEPKSELQLEQNLPEPEHFRWNRTCCIARIFFLALGAGAVQNFTRIKGAAPAPNHIRRSRSRWDILLKVGAGLEAFKMFPALLLFVWDWKRPKCTCSASQEYRVV